MVGTKLFVDDATSFLPKWVSLSMICNDVSLENIHLRNREPVSDSLNDGALEECENSKNLFSES